MQQVLLRVGRRRPTRTGAVRLGNSYPRSMKDYMPSTTRFAPAVVCLLAFLAAGCQQRQDELVYVYSEAVQDLSDDQQEQVRALLTRFYGTPGNPRLMVFDEQAVVDEDGAQSSEGEIDIAVVERIDHDYLKLGATV